MSQWLKDYRPEWPSTGAIKACLGNFTLHRRHRQLVWDIYSRTDFSHLRQGGGQNEKAKKAIW
jgi:hypothetical protein